MLKRCVLCAVLFMLFIPIFAANKDSRFSFKRNTRIGSITTSIKNFKKSTSLPSQEYPDVDTTLQPLTSRSLSPHGPVYPPSPEVSSLHISHTQQVPNNSPCHTPDPKHSPLSSFSISSRNCASLSREPSLSPSQRGSSQTLAIQQALQSAESPKSVKFSEAVSPLSKPTSFSPRGAAYPLSSPQLNSLRSPKAQRVPQTSPNQSPKIKEELLLPLSISSSTTTVSSSSTSSYSDYFSGVETDEDTHSQDAHPLLNVLGLTKDPNIKEKLLGKSMLMCLLPFGNTEWIEVLLAHNPASVNDQDTQGSSPLSLAAQMGDAHIISIILKHRPKKVYLPDSYGYTPVMYAAMKQCVKGVEAILTYDRTGLNREDLYGNTVLMLAAECGYTEVVEEVLKFKPKLYVQNKLKKDVFDNVRLEARDCSLQHEKSCFRAEVVRALLEYKSPEDIKREFGVGALNRVLQEVESRVQKMAVGADVYSECLKRVFTGGLNQSAKGKESSDVYDGVLLVMQQYVQQEKKHTSFCFGRFEKYQKIYTCLIDEEKRRQEATESGEGEKT